MTKSEEEDIRRAAATALQEIGDLYTKKSRIAALESYKPMREVAIEALVKIGAPAIEPLSAALKDEKWRVREAAAKALRQIKERL